MKKMISIVLFFISAGNCFGQQVTFQKIIGGSGSEECTSFERTSDGGYIIGANTNSFGTGSGYLIKTDQSGNISWTKTYIGIGLSFAKQTSDGGYIFTGDYLSYFILVKTDSIGNTSWTKTFSFGNTLDAGRSINETNDGGFIIAGSTNANAIPLRDYLIIRTNNIGDTLWTKIMGRTYDDAANYIYQTVDGGFIFSGFTHLASSGGLNFELCKLDSSGNLDWSNTYGGVSTEDPRFFQPTNDGNYIIGGYTSSFGAGSDDIIVMKIDSTGTVLWSKTYGGTGSDIGGCVSETNDGGFIIGGATTSFGFNDGNLYLIRIDSIGNLLWSKAYGGTGYDAVASIKLCQDGGFLMCGGSFSFGAGDYDIYLLKTDSLGNTGCYENPVTTTVTTPVISHPGNPLSQISLTPTISTLPLQEGTGGLVTTLCYTSAQENEGNNSFIIYPNPSTNNFTITFPNTINKGSIEIYTVFWGKIFNEKIFNASQKEIHLKNSAAGIYFVKVRDGEKEYCGKLIRQ